MAVRSQKLGLTWAIFGVFTLALLVLVVVLFWLVPSQANEALTEAVWERGKAVAKEIERKVNIAARPTSIDLASSMQVNEIVQGEKEISAVWVLVCANT